MCINQQLNASWIDLIDEQRKTWFSWAEFAFYDNFLKSSNLLAQLAFRTWPSARQTAPLPLHNLYDCCYTPTKITMDYNK